MPQRVLGCNAQGAGAGFYVSSKAWQLPSRGQCQGIRYTASQEGVLLGRRRLLPAFKPGNPCTHAPSLPGQPVQEEVGGWAGAALCQKDAPSSLQLPSLPASAPTLGHAGAEHLCDPKGSRVKSGAGIQPQLTH